MKEHPNLRVALVAIAAIIGAGFASGREVMTFFARFGIISYLGIVVACGVSGLLAAMILHFSKKTGSRTFPGIYTKEMGKICGESVDALYGLMLLITAAAMCAAGGELAALSLPIYFSRPLGVAATVLAALMGIYGGKRGLSFMGGLIVPLIVVFYFALFLDGRPAMSAALTLSGGSISSIPAACVMGALFAAFNLSLSGGVLCLHVDENTSPKKTGLLIGLLLLVMLIPANAALLAAGPAYRSMALPAVVLAGKWGVFGFYVCVAIFWIAVVSTLCAVLAPLIEQVRELPFAPLKKGAAPAVILLSLFMSAVGYGPLIDAGYPLLGWACSFILLALLAFL